MVEVSFIVFGILILVNAILIYAVQKNILKFEPLSFAILSMVFPMSHMIRRDLSKTDFVNKIASLIIAGNLVLFLALAIVYVLTAYNIINPWDSQQKILFTHSLFNTIYVVIYPTFLASTLPVIASITFSRYDINNKSQKIYCWLFFVIYWPHDSSFNEMLCKYQHMF